MSENANAYTHLMHRTTRRLWNFVQNTNSIGKLPNLSILWRLYTSIGDWTVHPTIFMLCMRTIDSTMAYSIGCRIATQNVHYALASKCVSRTHHLMLTFSFFFIYWYGWVFIKTFQTYQHFDGPSFKMVCLSFPNVDSFMQLIPLCLISIIHLHRLYDV